MILTTDLNTRSTAAPCLECRRPLTMRAELQLGDGKRGRGLYVCLGHPPATFRRVLHTLEALEAAGFTYSERFGTLKCPGCGTSGTLGQSFLHVGDDTACAAYRDERNTAQADQ